MRPLLNRTYTCPHCGDGYKKANARQNYCSIACAVWSRVNRGGDEDCWEWTGSRRPLGYGEVRWYNQGYTVSRLAWALHNNRDPGEMFVLHRCDNPPCCNPNHLFLGTNAENMADKEAKGRGTKPPVRYGSSNNKTRISPEAIQEIKNAPRIHGMGAILARKYGIARNTVYRIQLGKARVHG